MTPRIGEEPCHLSPPALVSVGWWFCFFCLTGSCFARSLAGTDGIVGAWPRGFHTRIDMHTPTHTDSSPLEYEPLSLVGYQKANFFPPVCLYYFFSLLYEKVAHETRRVKSNHAFCSVRQGCWFFGDLRICNCL